MAHQAQFEQIWERLRRQLASPLAIRNWTQHSDYIGQDFTAQQARRVHAGQMLGPYTS